MNKALILLFLFSAGSLIGWCIEFLFRRYFSNRISKKWVNPGFLVGPYLPLYGSGLTILYLLAMIKIPGLSSSNPVLNELIVIIFMAIAMTIIEYITGLIFIKGMHVMLWDYSKMRGNIEGIICPLFSFFWAVLGAFYYIFIHPHVLMALSWLSKNLAFSFFIGLFYGVFIIDCFYSFNLVTRLKAYADKYQIIVKYEMLKDHISNIRTEAHEKQNFLMPFSMRRHLSDTPFSVEKIFDEGKEYFSVSRIRKTVSKNLEKGIVKLEQEKEILETKKRKG